MPTFSFRRDFRTDTSEQYTVYRQEAEIGKIDVHLREDRTRVRLVITGPLPAQAEEELVDALEEDVLGSTAPLDLAPEIEVEIFRGERLAAFTDAPAPGKDDDFLN